MVGMGRELRPASVYRELPTTGERQEGVMEEASLKLSLERQKVVQADAEAVAKGGNSRQREARPVASPSAPQHPHSPAAVDNHPADFSWVSLTC